MTDFSLFSFELDSASDSFDSNVASIISKRITTGDHSDLLLLIGLLLL